MIAFLGKLPSQLLRLPGIRRACGAFAQRALFQPQMLFFHGVEESLRDERIQALHIRLAEFEPLMRHLKRHFHPIGLDEYHERLGAKRPNLSRCVLLTFDDGYRSNHRLVAPLLKSLDIPFTVYLTTQSIDTGERLPTFIARAALHLTEHRQVALPGSTQSYPLRDEGQRRRASTEVGQLLKSRPIAEIRRLIEALRGLLPESRWREVEEEFASDAFMTWQEVAELHRAGATIGAHGHEHVPLHAQLETGEASRQVQQSRDAIVARLGSCDHYAFPNGTIADISAEAVEAVMHTGFKTAVSTFSASLQASIHPFLLPRICVYQIDEFQRTLLKNRLNGSARRLRAWQAGMPGARHLRPLGEAAV